MNYPAASRIAALLLAPILGAAAAAGSAGAAPAGPTVAATPSTPMPAAPGAAPALPKEVSAKVEQRIRQLHGQLGITPAQQPQWEQFAQVMRDNAAQISQASADRIARVKALNAADNMQSYAQLAQVHATDMQKLASAFQSLYASFPEAQKQVADSVFHKGNAIAPRHRE